MTKTAISSAIISVGLAIVISMGAEQAQGRGGFGGHTGGFDGPKNTPGHLMQRFGSVPGHPGAAGYAPGHLKSAAHMRSARDFAPGHRTHYARHHRHDVVHHTHHRHHIAHR